MTLTILQQKKSINIFDIFFYQKVIKTFSLISYLIQDFFKYPLIKKFKLISWSCYYFFIMNILNKFCKKIILKMLLKYGIWFLLYLYLYKVELFVSLLSYSIFSYWLIVHKRAPLVLRDISQAQLEENFYKKENIRLRAKLLEYKKLLNDIAVTKARQNIFTVPLSSSMKKILHLTKVSLYQEETKKTHFYKNLSYVLLITFLFLISSLSFYFFTRLQQTHKNIVLAYSQAKKADNLYQLANKLVKTMEEQLYINIQDSTKKIENYVTRNKELNERLANQFNKSFKLSEAFDKLFDIIAELLGLLEKQDNSNGTQLATYLYNRLAKVIKEYRTLFPEIYAAIFSNQDK